MSPRVRYLLYFVYADIALGACLLLTFPYDTLARRLEHEARQSPGTSLAIGEIGPALPFGLRLADTTYRSEARDGGAERTLHIDRLRLVPDGMAALTGKAGVRMTADLLDGDKPAGTLQGALAMGLGGRKVELHFDDVSLSAGRWVESALGMQLAGRINGDIKLQTDKDGTPTSGLVNLTLPGAKLVGGKASGITLPAMVLGEPVIQADIADGVAKINKFEAKSPDVEISSSASITLKPTLSQSPLKGTLTFQPSEALMTRAPTVRAMMSLAAPKKKPGEPLELPLAGTLGSPRALPGMR